MLIIGQLPQSRGTITLKSKNPDDAPLCDPQILSHPLDRAIAVEAARRAWAIMSDPAAQADLDDALAAPASMDEEDILSFVQRTANTTWHMSCTAKMGRNDDTNAVVDTKFRVRGLEGLRIADMSVTPFLPNCHVMSVAYLIGDMCKERLVEEYGLAS
jgi:choline dehydrogenase-like flavoprotein